MPTIQRMQRSGKWNAMLYFLHHQWKQGLSTEMITMKVTWLQRWRKISGRDLLSYFDDCLYIQHPTDWTKYALLIRKINQTWR